MCVCCEFEVKKESIYTKQSAEVPYSVIAEARTTYSMGEEGQVRVEEQNLAVTAVAAEEKDSEVCDLLSDDVDRNDMTCR